MEKRIRPWFMLGVEYLPPLALHTAEIATETEGGDRAVERTPDTDRRLLGLFNTSEYAGNACFSIMKPFG